MYSSASKPPLKSLTTLQKPPFSPPLTALSAWTAFLQGNSSATRHLAPSEQQQVRGYMSMLLDIVQTAKFLEVRAQT